MSIGARIQQLRIENDFTQEQLAEKLEVSRQSVSKWEMDQAVPEVGKIIGLCQLFHVDADMLLMGTPKARTVNMSAIENDISHIKDYARHAIDSVEDDTLWLLNQILTLICHVETELNREPSNLELYGIEHFTNNAEERQQWFLQRAADRRKRNMDRERRRADRERRENDRKIREAGRGHIPVFSDTVIEETIYQPVYGNIVHDINGSVYAPIIGNIEAEIDGDISCGALEGNLDGEVTGSVYVSGVAILGYFRGKTGRNVHGNIDSCFDGTIGGSLYGNILGDLNGRIEENYSSLVDGDINGLVQGEITGNILGGVYGSVQGSVSGDIDGDVAGLIGGNVKGNILGDVTGVIEGDVIGNIDGNITGEIRGKVTGNINGDITGQITGGVEGLVSGNVAD